MARVATGSKEKPVKTQAIMNLFVLACQNHQSHFHLFGKLMITNRNLSLTARSFTSYLLLANKNLFF